MLLDREIPQCITGLYLFAVLNLLALFHVTLVNGEVLVTNTVTNNTDPIYRDLPASFGPGLPEEGITGYLVYVTPHDGCYKIDPPPQSKKNGTKWIAMVSRDNCTFVDKVMEAEKRGYHAVIVHNSYKQDLLIPMGGAGYVNIPSVFVGWTDGMSLAENYCYDCSCDVHKPTKGCYLITIDGRLSPFAYNPWMLWPFAVVVGVCFILMLIFMIVKWIRDLRIRRKSKLSSRHLKKIPTKKFKKGEDYDVCAICLDDYEEGDKLRVLPCSHVYHCKCIDPWLTKSKKTCPVCKRKVIPGEEDDSDSESDEDSEGPRPSERTPLLGHAHPPLGEASSTARASVHGERLLGRQAAFENSGLPEVTHVEETVPKYEVDEDSDSVSSDMGAVGLAESANQSAGLEDSSVVVEYVPSSSINQGFASDEDDDQAFQDEDGVKTRRLNQLV